MQNRFPKGNAMQHATVRQTVPSITPQRRDPAADTLDGALHPMHQELLARWSAGDPIAEPKLPLPARFAIAMGGACLAWGLVGGVIWSIAHLVG
jgi:hypothetical protein